MEIRTYEKENRERLRKKNQRTMAETRQKKKKNIPNLLTMFTKGERKYMQISKKAIILLSWFLHRKEFKKIFLSLHFFFLFLKRYTISSWLSKFVFFSNISCLQEHFLTERKKKKKRRRKEAHTMISIHHVSVCVFPQEKLNLFRLVHKLNAKSTII